MDMKKIAGAAVLAAGLLLGGTGSAWAAHLEDIGSPGDSPGGDHRRLQAYVL